MNTDLSGQTLAERYDLLYLVGEGGMGAVYCARDRELDELVALKVMRAELARDPAIVDRFRHEVKLARRVTHVNVARTFELGQAGGLMFCTMELISGESLRARLARTPRLPVEEAARISQAVCSALVAAHAVDVIHRDIKPDNILIATDGRVILADFGVAAVAVSDLGGQLSGTPAYMAPEQARGEPPTPATDVYSVGVVLYEMLTGRRAFPGEIATVLTAKDQVERLVLPPSGDVPAELVALVGRATTRDPADRIATAGDLHQLLGPWARTVAAPARLVPTGVSAQAQLRTVVVRAPSGGEATIHLAIGVHEALLHRLVRVPRLRVLPRIDSVDVPGAAVIELVAGAMLAVTIRAGDGRTVTIQLPLDVAGLELAAEAIVAALGDVLELERPRAAAHANEARELLLRARRMALTSFAGVRPAYEMVERAHALCPDDPRIAATLAMLHVRFLLFIGGATVDPYDRAKQLVARALATGPMLADSHVAAAHLELHTGEPITAALHFRRAIACSPYDADAHEGLGRMLLEAGFLDVAWARIEDALAISPHLNAARWELARAHILEGRWDIHDQIVNELRGTTGDRLVLRMRFELWRKDRGELATMREQILAADHPFERPLIERLLSVALDDAWAEHRDFLVNAGLTLPSPSRRRRTFVAQLIAEIAAYAGDPGAAGMLTDHAADLGLYDLHWLDNCPLLAVARATGQLARARVLVKRRADGILDALYGDHSDDARSMTFVAR